VTAEVRSETGMAVFASVVGGVVGLSYPFHNSIESTVSVSSVFDDPLGAVGFLQGVGTFHDISVTMFSLRFNVTSVSVVDTVVKSVLGMSLETRRC